jgi:hypothetical protein
MKEGGHTGSGSRHTCLPYRKLFFQWAKTLNLLMCGCLKDLDVRLTALDDFPCCCLCCPRVLPCCYFK